MRAAATVLVLLVASAPARADHPPVRRTGIGVRDGRLVMSVGVQDVIQPEAARRLSSGFATRILVRVALFRAHRPEPVATASRVSEIVYDLWDERFRVRITDSGAAPVQAEAATAEEAIALATRLVAFPVVDLARLERGALYRLSVRADLNPLSQELIAEVRRWLARPPGQGRLAPGDSFFGSVVSIFVNPRVEESERRVLFVSQTFPAPEARR